MKHVRSGRGRGKRPQSERDPLASRNGTARNGRLRHANGRAKNGHVANGAIPSEPRLELRLARPADVLHVPRIAHLLSEAARAGAIIAERPPEYLERAIRERRAVVVLRGELLVGFAAAHAWEDARFVSHSAMVLAPEIRGRGLSRRVKRLLLALTRRRWPQASIMSLTLSPAIERLNKSFGFEPVPYCDLTKDPEFWKGCEGCIHHAHLKRNQQQDCHCWSGLLLPPGQSREKIVPRDAQGHRSASRDRSSS